MARASITDSTNTIINTWIFSSVEYVKNLKMRHNTRYASGRATRLEIITNFMNSDSSSLTKDPDWAPLYNGLAAVWGGRMQMGFVPPSIAMPLIYENLNKAFELDPEFAGSHFTNAIFGVWAEWNWDKGEKEFLKALFHLGIF